MFLALSNTFVNYLNDFEVFFHASNVKILQDFVCMHELIFETDKNGHLAVLRIYILDVRFNQGKIKAMFCLMLVY